MWLNRLSLYCGSYKAVDENISQNLWIRFVECGINQTCMRMDISIGWHIEKIIPGNERKNKQMNEMHVDVMEHLEKNIESFIKSPAIIDAQDTKCNVRAELW